MQSTPNCDLYLEDNDKTKFKEWRDKMNGVTDSNMIRIDHAIGEKANAEHTHKKTDITDFPGALPANGGNADTVDGKHATSFIGGGFSYPAYNGNITLDNQKTDFHGFLFNVAGAPGTYGFLDVMHFSGSGFIPSTGGVSVQIWHDYYNPACVFCREFREGSWTNWVRVSDNTSVATQSANGLMSAADKAKLDGLDTKLDELQTLINGIWVAGETNALYYSIDGKTWKRGTFSNWDFRFVYNANGLWVVGTYNDGLQYSTDGKTWTKSNITSGYIKVIHNANGMWVAGGHPNIGAYYSTDGKTWTKSNVTGISINAIHYANGIWVLASDNNGLYYSTDGQTWTQSNITGGCTNHIYNANGIWVAGGSYGLYYSTNGKTWTQSNVTGKTFRYVYNAHGMWVAGGSSVGLYYSTDGKTWTQSNITDKTINTVCNANGVWIVGTGSNGLYYSTDGKSWTQSNITSGNTYAIYNANGIWIAGSGAGLYYSADGRTWTKSNLASGTFYSAYNAGRKTTTYEVDAAIEAAIGAVIGGSY